MLLQLQEQYWISKVISGGYSSPKEQDDLMKKRKANLLHTIFFIFLIWNRLEICHYLPSYFYEREKSNKLLSQIEKKKNQPPHPQTLIFSK